MNAGRMNAGNARTSNARSCCCACSRIRHGWTRRRGTRPRIHHHDIRRQIHHQRVAPRAPARRMPSKVLLQARRAWLCETTMCYGCACSRGSPSGGKRLASAVGSAAEGSGTVYRRIPILTPVPLLAVHLAARMIGQELQPAWHRSRCRKIELDGVAFP